MIRHRLAPLALALSLLTNVASGAGVVMYGANERPNPRDVASILSRAPTVPEGLKMRSIRVLPTPSVEADADALGSGGAATIAPVAASDPTPATEAKSTSPSRPAADDTPTSLALPVQFAFDSARILASAHPQIDAVAAGVKLAGPKVKVVIEGHTDAVGSAQYNLRLSWQRAEAVRSYLITRHGIEPGRLRVVGMGKFAPLNKSKPTAPENRRVEFRAEA